MRTRLPWVAYGPKGRGLADTGRFLEEGAFVVLSSPRQEILDAAQRELDPPGARVALVAGDVSSPAAAARVIEAGISRFGGVDVLVNSTGIFRRVAFVEQTEEHVEEEPDSILRPTFYTPIPQAVAA